MAAGNFNTSEIQNINISNPSKELFPPCFTIIFDEKCNDSPVKGCAFKEVFELKNQLKKTYQINLIEFVEIGEFDCEEVFRPSGLDRYRERKMCLCKRADWKTCLTIYVLSPLDDMPLSEQVRYLLEPESIVVLDYPASVGGSTTVSDFLNEVRSAFSTYLTKD